MSGWSIVWLAPVCLSSGGRSAVSRIMGTPSVAASTTAGSPLATAVPEVVIQAAGSPVARAYPTAAKAVPRSSKWTRLSAFSLEASAATRGVEREPGATQKKPTPLRTSSSTMRVAQRRLACGAAGGVKPEHPGEVADLLLDLSPLGLGYGTLDDPGPREEGELVPADEPGPYANGELCGVRSDPTDWAGEPPAIEGLGTPDLLERPLLRVSSDRRSRMQRPQHLGVRNALAQGPPHPGEHVTPARQLHLRDATLDLELGAEWSERLSDADPDVVVLGLVFLAAEQVVAQLVVVRLGRAARSGPRHGLALYGTSLAAEEPLGRGANECHPRLRLDVEVEAVWRRFLQALGKQSRVHRLHEAELRAAGEHHLVQPPLRERRECPLHVAAPAILVWVIRPRDRLRQGVIRGFSWEREALYLVQDLRLPPRVAWEHQVAHQRRLPVRGVQLEARQNEAVRAERRPLRVRLS